MADAKISALPASTTPLAGTETVPLVQSGVTKKVSVANLTAGRSVSVSELISDDGTHGRWTIGQDAGGNKLFSTTPGFGGWRTASLQANGTGPNMTWGFDGNTTVGVGNLVIGTAAKGIDFSANTGAAGETSSLLDWYEEGAWTPTVAGVTLADSSGLYTRIGRQVFVSFDITWPTTSDATAIIIGSMPFAPVANSGVMSTGYTTYANILNGICGTSGIALYGYLGNPSSAPQNVHMSTLRLIASAVYTV